MITHFSNVELNTVSVKGVKQFYSGQLRFPIVEETSQRITFQPVDHCTITFNLAYEPISPVHIAFEVPNSKFLEAVSNLKASSVQLLKWDDGREIDNFETGENVYFRDGDGNLLEIISHFYIKEDVIEPKGSLSLIYLREVGFPVPDVIQFREWLVETLNVKLDKILDNFSFAIGGTAHCVITSINRKWIPISMVALPPKIKVTFGVTDHVFIRSVAEKLQSDEIISFQDGELHFNKLGYYFILKVSDIGAQVPSLLNLPLSRK